MAGDRRARTAFCPSAGILIVDIHMTVLHRNITDTDAPGKLQGTGVRNRTRDHKVYTPKT